MWIIRVKSQICRGMAQYDRCSPVNECVCFHIAGAIDIGICSHQFLLDCSELVPYERSNNLCNQSDHECVHHPLCHNFPVCYPVPSYNRQLCPPITSKRANSESTDSCTAQISLKGFVVLYETKKRI